MRRRRLLAGAAMVPLLGAVLGALIVAAAPASAHAVLESTTPASGSSLRTPPSGITLTFDEAVRAPAYIVVTGPGGVRVDDGKARVRGAIVTTGLRRTTPAGRYTVAFRVGSDDGHPVEGEFAYSVIAAATSQATEPAQSPPSPSAAAPARTSAAAAVGGNDGGHLLHVLGGFAVVLAGAGALVYERVQRRRHPEDSAASR
jgi:methionine-rich copper-binding protein CopC